MLRSTLLAVLCTLFCWIGDVAARPAGQLHELAEPMIDVDIVGNRDGRLPAPQKALQDTIWIADWTFDSGGECVDTGWTHVDNSVRNDGTVWWDVVADFDGNGGILGNAAALGYQNNPCCEEPNGYDNRVRQRLVPGDQDPLQRRR
jgi:hypothetical protein